MTVLITVAIGAVPLLLGYLYYRLRWCRFTQFAHFPQPPTSLVWGNLLTLHEKMKNGDVTNIDTVLSEVREEMGNPPFLLLDVRPVGYPFLAIFDYTLAEQISSPSKGLPYSVEKSAVFKDFHEILGSTSIVSINGEHWKSLRKRFNPCFAPQHLMTLLPLILEKTNFFLNHMDRLAISGESFELGDYCTRLTFDIIGAAVLDLDFKAQEEEPDEILTMFRDLSNSYIKSMNRYMMWIRPHLLYTRKTLSWRIHRRLRQLVQRKFATMKAEEEDEAATASPRTRTRSVLSRSLEGIARLDATMTDEICDQLKTFLFGGHETTSTLLQWAFYELSRTPRALAAVRAELDSVFGRPGTDPAATLDILRARGGDVLRKLTYTSAVIKETLRLYPPAATSRAAPPGSGLQLTTRDGTPYCADGLLIYVSHMAIQRDPAVYGDTAELFMPERWLGDAKAALVDGRDTEGDDATYEGRIPPGAWRPFERGPRNCIGQELANIEAQVILAATVRHYDFVKVGLGELALDEKQQPILDENGTYKTKSTLVNAKHVTSHPIDNCVVRVKMSEYAVV